MPAKLGVPVTCTDIFGTAGSACLDGLRLPQPYAEKVTSLRHLAGEFTTEITMLIEVIADLLAGDRGYQVIQQLPGIGPVMRPAGIRWARQVYCPCHPGLEAGQGSGSSPSSGNTATRVAMIARSTRSAGS